MKKERTPKPTHCGSCVFYQEAEHNAICVFDGDKSGFCNQSRMKVYSFEDPCPWGILKPAKT